MTDDDITAAVRALEPHLINYLRGAADRGAADRGAADRLDHRIAALLKLINNISPSHP